MITLEIVFSAVLEKITLPSSSGHATFSSCKSLKVQNVSSESANKEIISNTIAEKLSRTVKQETESCANKSTITEKVGDCTISGGGDASLVMKTCQKLNNVQLSSNKIQKSILEKHEL